MRVAGKNADSVSHSLVHAGLVELVIFFVVKILRVSSTCSARARALEMIGNSLEALLPVEGGWKASTVCDSPSLFPSLGTATGANGENILS